MRFTTFALSSFLLFATSPVVTSFVPATRSNDLHSRSAAGVSEPLFLSPEDLTNYLAKAHEEKLRALKDVETKKNGEIQVRGKHGMNKKLRIFSGRADCERKQASQKILKNPTFQNCFVSDAENRGYRAENADRAEKQPDQRSNLTPQLSLADSKPDRKIQKQPPSRETPHQGDCCNRSL